MRKIFLMFFVMFLIGCGRVDKDLSKDPRYISVIGKEYKTKQEMVIYQLDSEKRKNRIGLHRYGGEGDLPLKEEMKSKFPFKYHDAIILGVLPSGSKLKITQVRLEGGSAQFIYYYTKIIDSNIVNFLGMEVYPMCLLELNREIPQFDPEYVEEIKSESFGQELKTK